MKKSISITITDIDDLESVLSVLENLFKTLLLYYGDKEDLTGLYL